jgi:hypothetical protein
MVVTYVIIMKGMNTRKNGEPTDAELIQQNGENQHDNDLKEGAVLLPSK